jgi:O-acetyl-ADP-ribose deacetylase (regulator of RNase III)
MSKLYIQTGDLLKEMANGEFDVIVHGCNCWNTMGSGIAKSIKELIPDAWQADQETIPGDKSKLGNYSTGFDFASSSVVVNAYTQFNTARYPGEDVFEYESFQTILAKLAVRFGDKLIGLPMIGMGLAGGDQERILPMIESFADQIDSTGGRVYLIKWENGK